MKKYTWIVALLIALSLALIGCPGDSGGGGDDDKKDDGNKDGGETVVKTLTITKNEYGKMADGTAAEGATATNGFQLTLKGDAAPLVTVATGDVYKLTMKFTTNRDVDEALQTGIVDTDENCVKNKYWYGLTWDSLGTGEPEEVFKSVKKGEVVEFEKTFAALSDDGTKLATTALMFQTDMEPHDLGPLVLECTVYEFVKVE